MYKYVLSLNKTSCDRHIYCFSKILFARHFVSDFLASQAKMHYLQIGVQVKNGLIVDSAGTEQV